jgi:2-polyprenyl-3-methyl-5-hydroxy-6-metoxy-1,4-benzoquinol methylase
MTDSIQLEDVPCPFGCPKSDEIVLTGRDLLHNLPGSFTVVKCRSCGLMRTNPRPTPGTIGFYYPDDYGPYIGTNIQKIKPKSTSRMKKLLRPVAKWFFNFNYIILPPLPPGHLLEVGCASGAFLHAMAGQGWGVEGLEYNQKAARSAASLGYQVHIGSLEKAPEPKEKYNLIVGWMVLEHLHDPIGGLQKLRDWAKPGAWLVLSTPNSGSFQFRLFKERWYDLHLPNHTYHFTPETLGHVLEAGGWKLEKVYHQRSLANLIASTGYVLRDKGYSGVAQKLIDFPVRGNKWVYAIYPIGWLFSVFGQTGRMTIWARVKS